MSKILS